MKLQKLSMTNFQIVSALDLEFQTPAHLFAGGNEQGKSSIAEAVTYALIGRPTRVSDKKADIKQLVRDGAKTGSVELTIDGLVNSVELPKGDVTDAADSRDMDLLPYVLNPSLFAGLDEAKRRAMLFKLTGISVKADQIRERLTRRKCNAEKIEASLPMLRAGFDSACSEAKAKQSESRGAWKAIAGENYGSAKAENWAAEKPEFDEEIIKDIQRNIDTMAAEINNGNQMLGEFRARQSAYESAASRAGEKVTEEQVSALYEKLVKTQAARDEFKQKLETTRQKAGKKPEQSPLACPHCGGLVEHKSGSLIEHVAPEFDSEAAAELPGQTAYFNGLVEAAQIAEKAHDKAVKSLEAHKALADLAPVSQDDIAAVHTTIKENEQLRTDLLNALAIEESKRERSISADQRTADAAAHHKDVSEWGEIAEAFAPDGIPSELLADALKPVNQRLQQTAVTTDWKQVMIRPDMSVLVDGRNYGLMSESAKWRADAAIGETISFLSGLRLLMLDRIDVLEPAQRPALIRWIDGLAQDNEISTALLFGTFKAKPEGLPQSIGVSWIENGELI
jgi:hypothetical protein